MVEPAKSAEWSICKLPALGLLWVKEKRQMSQSQGLWGSREELDDPVRKAWLREQGIEPRLPSSHRLSYPPSHVIPHTVFRQSTKKKHRHPGSLREEARAGNRKRSVYSWQSNIQGAPTHFCPDSRMNSPRASDFCLTDSVGLRTICSNPVSPAHWLP